jgi:hypothetical protein
MLKHLSALLACALLVSPSLAAEEVRGRSVPFTRQFVDPLMDLGWVMLRHEGQKQWLYFGVIQRARCVLKEIRYSVNSDALDRVLMPTECDLRHPYSLSNDVPLADIAVAVDDPVTSVAVQAVFSDGSTSPILTYAPCEAAGEATCVRRIN